MQGDDVWLLEEVTDANGHRLHPVDAGRGYVVGGQGIDWHVVLFEQGGDKRYATVHVTNLRKAQRGGSK